MKRFDSASNATPAVKYVGHGGYSGLLRDRLDRRTELGRGFNAYKAALIIHLGGESNITTPELVLVDQAARLQLMANVAWNHMQRHNTFSSDGSPVGAYDAYMRSTRELRSVFDTLGLKRREKGITDLATYLRSKRPGGRLRIKGRELVAEEDGNDHHSA